MTRFEQNELVRREKVTPELIDYYVREGRRLRAQTLRRMGRSAWRYLAQNRPADRGLWSFVADRMGRRRRMGRLTPRAVR